MDVLCYLARYEYVNNKANLVAYKNLTLFKINIFLTWMKLHAENLTTNNRAVYLIYELLNNSR